jgi:hypothetical protein
MILDIALVVIALIAIATGYNKGALATLLSILGYFGGGVAGFALANWYSAEWKGLTAMEFIKGFSLDPLNSSTRSLEQRYRLLK